MNKAMLVVVRNPFHPALGREQRDIAVGQTLDALAPQGDKPFIILRNGQAVLRKDWHAPVERDDLIAILFLPQGGGGGGSNPLKIVLSVALMVIAPQIGAAAMNTAWAAEAVLASGGFITGSMISMAVSGAVSFVGNALINAMAGGSAPKTTTALQQQSFAAPSPTYNLQAQGNMARLDAAIPVQYGRVCAYPDFAAQPYVEFSNNEQYLYQLLCLGAGEYDIEAIRIEDTAISSWEEITYEVIDPHGECSLFPTNVNASIEVSGQEMDYDTWLGPFIANAADTDANALGLDFVFPRGLYYANDQGGLSSMTVNWTVEARPVDDLGAPVAPGTWTVLGNESLSAATATAQRISKRYTVTAGRYEVRVKRTNAKVATSRYGHEIDWAGLRAYMPETRDFGDVTLLAFRMRATNNLSQQASRKINVISTRKLPAWNGSAFGTAAATRSIAWALADACTNTTWGAGLANARIDLDGLLALDAIWSARGDEFNGRFDSLLTFWEALTKIARAGRTYPYMQGGIIRFTRDQAQTTPVALYSMRNMVRGSFSVQYLTPHEAQADAVDVAYFDDQVWAQRRVQAKLADSSASKPVKIEFFGITDRDQAFREGVYEAACNRYRRKLIKFATDMEGFIPAYGDLIAVAHDMPQWGQTAEAVAWNAGTSTLNINEALTWGAGTHYIALRKRNGGVDGPIAVTAGSGENELVLAAPPSFTPYTGQSEERTHIAFGPGETWRQPARVISVRPRGLEQVEIECVNEDASVHTAEDGQVAPAAQYSQLTTRWTTPVLTRVEITGQPDNANIIVMSWEPAPGADHYRIEISGDGGSTWEVAGDTTGANISVPTPYGAATWVRIAPVGLTRGAWLTYDYSPIYLATLAIPPATPDGLYGLPEGSVIRLSWSANPEADVAGYQLRYGGTGWDDSVYLALVTATQIKVNPDWTGDRLFRLKAYDTIGNLSSGHATATVSISVPTAPSITAQIAAENVVLSWAAPAATLPIAEYEIRHGASWEAGTSLGKVTATTFRQKTEWVGTRNYWIAATDSAGNVGAAGSVSTVISAPSAPLSLRAEVVDNNVLLSWNEPASSTLPISTYTLRRGDTWAGATDLGTKSGLFTTLFETTAGLYTYWVAAVDTYGNVGTPAAIGATVNQPPDYVLKVSIDSIFDGTATSAVDYEGTLAMLVDATETWEEHFTTRSWATIQDQIDAGYTYYLEPGTTTAEYVETFDYGATLLANKITVSYSAEVVTGEAAVTIDILVSNDDITYTTYADTLQIYATNFRYIKVRINATTATSGLVKINSLNIRLDSKLRSISGTKTCTSSDSGGTTIYLTDDRSSGGNKEFVDVDSISITPLGTTPVIAVYDFVDAVNPLSFKVLLFNTSGTRVTGDVSYVVRGF